MIASEKIDLKTTLNLDSDFKWNANRDTIMITPNKFLESIVIIHPLVL